MGYENLSNEKPLPATLKMSVEKLKIRNFKAKLPNDYLSMISVTGAHGNSFMYIPVETGAQYRNTPSCFNNKAYCLKKDLRGTWICFFGSYSNYFLVRCVQKIIDYIKPKRVIVKYFTTDNPVCYFS